MKRTFSLILIALLLLLPVLSTHAEDPERIFADEGTLTAEEIDSLNARAEEIFRQRGVSVGFFFYADEADLIAFAEQFLAERITDPNAIVLGVNADYYHFVKRGDVANAAFPDSVCDNTLWEAFRTVKNDNAGKVLAYLNAADSILESYLANVPAEPDPLDVPSYIARTDGGKPTLVDREELVSATDAAMLSSRLREIGSKYRCDVVIVTVPSLGSKSSEEYADDFFDYNGYGYGATPDANGVTVNGDGILLLISMEDRDFAISTSGYGITAFTDYGIQEYLEPAFLPYLSNNNFTRGFNAFAEACDRLLSMARDENMPYDCKHIYVDEGAMTQTEIYNATDLIERTYISQNVALYVLQNASVTDLDAALSKFLSERVSEPDAMLLGIGANGHRLLVKGSYAKEKLSDKDLASIEEAFVPYLNANDLNGAVNAYIERSDEILSKRPLNLVTLVASFIASGILGMIPVSSMKRQLTSVSKQTAASTYMEPNSFAMTQNSDVLLGKNVSRSVHVVQSSSSGGGRGGGGGGSFHGGSSTHTSSSGGSHGGHSGKF